MVLLPDQSKIASLDVDAQCGFTPLCPDELPVPEGHSIAAALNEQAKLAQYRLGSKDAHPENAVWVCDNTSPVGTPITGEHVDVCWPKHCVPGTKGFELLPTLPHPAEYDFFVWKGIEPDMHPYGACYHDLNENMSTGLIEFLKDKNVNTIIIGGLATDYCVKNTAIQLAKAGFQVILNLAACQGLSDETTKAALKEMREQGIKIIHRLDELEAAS